MKIFKAFIGLFFLVTLVVGLSACTKEITLTSDVTELTLEIGEEQTISYETNDDDGVTFSSSNDSIVTVDETGKITAVSDGTAIIEITSKTNSEVKVEISVTVEKPEPTSLTITGESMVALGETITLTAAIDPEEADQGVTWTSSDDTVVTVDANGVVTPLQEGVVTITATSNVNSEITDTHDVMVVIPEPTAVTISGDSSVLLGGTLTLTADVTPDLADSRVTWASIDETIATVDANGVVTPIKEGTVTITATSIVITSLTATHEVTVVLPDPTTVTISGNSTVTLAETLQLTAVVAPDLADQGVTWASSDETIATVDANGLVTPKALGTVTITATSVAKTEVVDSIEITIGEFQYDEYTLYVDSDFANSDYIMIDGTKVYSGINGFATINDALDAMPADTQIMNIIVMSGTYSEFISINRSNVNLIGPNHTINPNTGVRVEEAILNGVITVGETVAVSNVYIAGFEMTGTAQIETGAEGVDGLTIENIYAHDLNYTVDTSLFYMTGSSSNINIINNKVLDLGGTVYSRAIWSMSNNITVSGNTIENVSRDLLFQGVSGNTVITNNNIINVTYRPLHIINFTGNVSITNNYIDKSGNTAIAVYDTIATLEENYIDISNNVIVNVAKGIGAFGIDLDEGVTAETTGFTAHINYNMITLDASLGGSYILYGTTDTVPVDASHNFLGINDNGTISLPDASMIMNDIVIENTYYVSSSFDGTTPNQYTTITDALAAIPVDNELVTINVLPGTYTESITIDKSNVRLVGPNDLIDPNTQTRHEEAVLSGVITVGGTTEVQNVSISGFKFTGDAQVTGSDNSVNGFVFDYNLVQDINNDFISFEATSALNDNTSLMILNNRFENMGAKPIYIVYAENVTIENNVMSAITGDNYLYGSKGVLLVRGNDFSNTSTKAVHIVSFLDGEIRVTENYFSNTGHAAISIWGKEIYEEGMIIEVTHNTIVDSVKGIHIDPEYFNGAAWVADKVIYADANYNIMKNISAYYGYSSDLFPVNFTKNYWDGVNPSSLPDGSIYNISQSYYADYYTNEEDVPSKDEVMIVLPTDIIITNPVTTIKIGETYQVEYTISPEDVTDSRLIWSSSDPTIVLVSSEGTITALKGGTVTITVQSAVNPNVSTSFDVTVEVDPGIELSFSEIGNNLMVGDALTITATPFPNTEASRTIAWTSSNESVATVDANGLVTAISAGEVTITAAFADDTTVNISTTLVVYDSLDNNNLLDLLTQQQDIQSLIHEFTAIGSFNYDVTTYQSVSNYYFGDITITESIIGESYYTRSMRKMEPLPEGLTAYNPQNIHWVVVHDTANTNSGATAEMHATYLHNLTNSGTEAWVSWHYTVDENDIYQHVPDDERTYHAGDGSRLVGDTSKTGTSLGGGNTNGIGIEMAVNQGSDIYRTWQKTAKLVASKLVQYNLPIENFNYHNDYSGKDCPRTLRTAGLTELFEEMVAIEYEIAKNHSDATITMTTNNPEYLDNKGRIIKMPLKPMTVSYTVTVEENGVTESRTFYTYLPGLLS